MVGIQKVGGIPELANPQLKGLRAEKLEQSPNAVRDEFDVSSKALQASKALGMFDETQEERVRREERVTQVRDSLEKGLYKLQDVLLQVAARITKYVTEINGSERVANSIPTDTNAKLDVQT